LTICANFFCMNEKAGKFRERLASGRPILLDAAMGTELQRRDAPCRLPLWSALALIEDAEMVSAVHRDEVAAGAQILTANTFRTHPRSLAKAGFAARATELTRLAVELAREAAGTRDIFVAGSLSPLEDCYRPDLAPGDAEMAREHAAQARALAEAGADLILAETHNSIREAAAAARAARETGLPVIVSFVTDGAGQLLSGEQVSDAAREIAALSTDAIGINCVPADRLADDLGLLAEAVGGIPLVAYGNLGPPVDPAGTRFVREIPPVEYGLLASGWLAQGARIVGGCCGTDPGHTAALAAMLRAAPTEGTSPSGTPPSPRG
jgi:S-methylmethionine-dependent homocysteine/selenocysteine methylase